MVDVIPEGEIGEAKVMHFEIEEEKAKFFNLQMLFNGSGSRRVDPGRYAKLFVGNKLMMSDTRAEQQDHLDIVREAQGDVLIAGLGLGLVTDAILRKSEVESVTVIELSADVIALVGPHLEDSRLTIVEADIFTWKPEKGRKFDAIWFDIWPDLCTDYLPEIGRLHQRAKYWKRSRDSFMNSWGRDFLRYQKRQEEGGW
jgi:hypothetical protein